MQIVNNTQQRQDRISSTGVAGSGNQSQRSALERLATSPTTADSLVAAPSAFDSLLDHGASEHTDAEPVTSGISLHNRASTTDNSKIVSLQNTINELEKALETATGRDSAFLASHLAQARDELRQESLKVIENELIERNDTPRPVGEAYESLGDVSLSEDDLKALAAGPEDDPVAIAARTILEQEGGFESIARGKSVISLGDIQRARLDAQADFENLAEPDDGIEDDYEPPAASGIESGRPGFTISSTANQPEVGQVAFDAQQDAIEQAIQTGEEVSFVNGTGQSVYVTVTPVDGYGFGPASYTVQVREGDKTDTIRIDSELSTEDTIAAIANIVDWGSSLETVGPDVPTFPKRIEFRAERDHRAAASYTNSLGRMTFFNGLENVNFSTYVHEQAHVIGYALHDPDPASDDFHSTPEGWEEVIEGSASPSPSDYGPDSNTGEDFAESVAAYMVASRHGPEALAEFREAYPDRSAYIEEFVINPGPPRGPIEDIIDFPPLWDGPLIPGPLTIPA